MHTGEKPYKCDQCSYSSAFKYNLINHQRTHTCKKKSKSKCNKYSVTAAEKANLIVHKRKHTGGKPNKCDRNNFETPNKISLLQNVKKIKFCRNFGGSRKPNTTSRDQNPINHTPSQRQLINTCCQERVIKVILYRLTKDDIVYYAHKLNSISHPCVNRVTEKTGQFSIHQKSNAGQTPSIGNLCSNTLSRRSNLGHHEREHGLERPSTSSNLDNLVVKSSKSAFSNVNTIKHIASSNPLVQECIKLNVSAVKEEPLDFIDIVSIPSLVTCKEVKCDDAEEVIQLLSRQRGSQIKLEPPDEEYCCEVSNEN